MYAGVTALNLPWKRPSKSVKYLEVFSSSSLDLTPTFSKCTHIENKMSQFRTIHKPLSSCINNAPHLLIMPFRHFIRNKQRFIVTKHFRNTVTCHSRQCVNNQILYRISHMIICEKDWIHMLLHIRI